jgi:putative holliday junction resolvase
MHDEIRVTYNEPAMATTGRASSGEKSAPAAKTERILAVDYGRKRMGLAISDELGLTAHPIGTLARVNRQRDLRRLRETCRARGVTHIIVGQPLHITGEAGQMAEEAARFAARLGKATGLAVELVDERLTSWEAERTVAETRSAVKRKRKAIDDVAAAVMLREYLGKCGGRARGDLAEKE